MHRTTSPTASSTPADDKQQPTTITEPSKNGPPRCHISRLPTEILALIAKSEIRHERVLRRSDLARCIRVSWDWFDTFGSELYRHIRIMDKVFGMIRCEHYSQNRYERLSVTNQRLLEHVEILEINPILHWFHPSPEMMEAIRRNLNVLIFNKGFDDNDNYWPNEQWASLSRTQLRKLVIRDRWPSQPDWDRLRRRWMDKPHPLLCGDGLPSAAEIVLHLQSDTPHRLQRTSALPLVSGSPGIHSLVLIYPPIHNEFEQHSIDFMFSRLDLENPSMNSEGAYDASVCGALVRVCMSTNDNCSIMIVNIDQAPLWTHTKPVDDFPFRSKTGSLCEIVEYQYEPPIEYLAEDQYETPFEYDVEEINPDSYRFELAEEEIEDRLTDLQVAMRLTTRAAIRAGGVQDDEALDMKVEDKMNHIRFITLQEYLDIPERRHEFLDPEVQFWA